MKSAQLFSSGTADLLPTTSQRASTPALNPFSLLSLSLFTIPFFPVWPSLPWSFQPVPLLHPLHLPLPVPSLPPHSLVPPHLAHPCCVCLSSLFLGSFSPFPPTSPPPFPKPAWQRLLQEGRLISIANTQRPPQPDINLHLSVMNISHLPREGFIQHGRVGRGKRGTWHHSISWGSTGFAPLEQHL